MKISSEKILQNDPVIAYHLQQVIKYLKPDKVILFGSKAKETAGKGSDTDLAVITDALFDDSEIIGALDVVDFKTLSSHWQRRIEREGIVLYERKS